MLLWVGFAVLTAAVLALLMRSLRGGEGIASNLDSRDADLAVYRDQLAEIDRERAEGLLQGIEAETARAEIGRRILARAEASTTSAAARSAGSGSSRWLGILATVPVAAVGLYLVYGSPALPGLPHASRIAVRPDKAGVEELVARVEARLKEHPGDGQGWDVLGPVYLMQQRFPEAADAFRRSIAILGSSAKRQWGLAQSLIGAGDGAVSAEARAALEKVLSLEPGRNEVRFWIAYGKEQDGKREEAVAEYRAILASSPAEAPWRGAVEDRLAGLGAAAEPARGPRLAAGNSAATPADRGPSASDVAAAQAMSPEAQQEMIGKMVAGLAQRLKDNGLDLAGWQKLVRAYKVLGRDADARKALADARASFAGNAAALEEIGALARSLGFDG